MNMALTVRDCVAGGWKGKCVDDGGNGRWRSFRHRSISDVAASGLFLFIYQSSRPANPPELPNTSEYLACGFKGRHGRWLAAGTGSWDGSYILSTTGRICRCVYAQADDWSGARGMTLLLKSRMGRPIFGLVNRTT